jgi:kinetochore protein Mis13/DSN1
VQNVRLETDIGAVYDNKDGDFEFTKRAKPSKKPATRTSNSEKVSGGSEPTASSAPLTAQAKLKKSGPAPTGDDAPKTTRKPRGKLPMSPEDNAATKTGRRPKRAFQEIKSPSPQRTSHAQPQVNHDRSPSPGLRPVTVKKKRQTERHTPAAAPEAEDKTTKIALPFADTPIIKRNKEMRKASADSSRRSSTGMRGRRASSLIDEGRGSGKFTFSLYSRVDTRFSLECVRWTALLTFKFLCSTTTPRSTHSRILQAHCCTAYRTDTDAMFAWLVWQ